MSIEPVAEKLEKLLRMLSSPREGEVVAAAQAIMRTLKGVGADIHELAACVKRAAERDKPAAARDMWRDVEPNWQEIATECRDRGDGRLTPREHEFVNDMVRWTVYRKPSEKQAKWLHSIYVRLGRRQ
jgi:hypothetical protein